MADLETFFLRFHSKPRVENKRVLSSIIFLNRNGLRGAMGLQITDPARPLTARGRVGARPAS